MTEPNPQPTATPEQLAARIKLLFERSATAPPASPADLADQSTVGNGPASDDDILVARCVGNDRDEFTVRATVGEWLEALQLAIQDQAAKTCEFCRKPTL